VELLAVVLDRLVAASGFITLMFVTWGVLAFAESQAPSHGVPRATAADAGTWAVTGAIVLGRLAYVVPDWPLYLRRPVDLVFINHGLSFYGGLIGALTGLGLLAWRRGLPLGRVADLFAPPVALGIMAFRSACLVRGDCGGALANPPLGITLPGHVQARYPADLIEAGLVLALALWLRHRRPRRAFAGELALILLAVYPMARSLVEFLRINVGSWPTGQQIIGLIVSVAALVFWLMLRARSIPRPALPGGG
jgi:phosphatidylglycerol---prolipoprotein diacylglyceryl transferase